MGIAGDTLSLNGACHEAARMLRRRKHALGVLRIHIHHGDPALLENAQLEVK